MEWTINGATAYAYTGGKALRAELNTVVLIHGAQNDHSVWALQSRYLAHHNLNVLAVDLPGHGRSGGAALSSVEQMADWLLALLSQAGISSAMLAGHSMGSLIALEAAHRAPAVVKRVALLGTAFPMRVSDALLNAAREQEQSAIDMVNIWSHARSSYQPAAPGPGFSVSGMSRRLMQRISAINPAQVFYTDFAACNAYANGEQAAASLDCPALIIAGKNDMMTPLKATGLLTQALKQHQLVVLPDCGHAMMSEQAALVRQHLMKFMA